MNSKVENCILDGEILYKSNEGDLLSFQEIEKKTTNRQIVHNKYPSVYLFDIIHINGKSLVKEDILTRKGYIEHYFPPESKYIEIGKSDIIDLANPIEAKNRIDSIMNESLKFHCEGLFLKIVDKDISFYDTSGSSRTQWIKYKGNFIQKNSGILVLKFL